MLRARRYASRPRSSSVSSETGHCGQHLVGFLAGGQPRQRMRTKEIRARRAVCADRRFREAICRAVSLRARSAPRAAVRSRSVSGVRSESRLNDARRTTLRMSSLPGADASSVADLSAQSSQSGFGGSRPSHLAVERMRQSHLDSVVGFRRRLSGRADGLPRWRRDPQSAASDRHFERFPDGQRVDHLTDGL